MEIHSLEPNPGFPYGISFEPLATHRTFYEALQASGYIGAEPTLQEGRALLFGSSEQPYLEPGQLVAEEGSFSVTPARLKTLVAGANIALTTVGEQITIASQGGLVQSVLAPLSVSSAGVLSADCYSKSEVESKLDFKQNAWTSGIPVGEESIRVPVLEGTTIRSALPGLFCSIDRVSTTAFRVNCLPPIRTIGAGLALTGTQFSLASNISVTSLTLNGVNVETALADKQGVLVSGVPAGGEATVAVSILEGTTIRSVAPGLYCSTDRIATTTFRINCLPPVRTTGAGLSLTQNEMKLASSIAADTTSLNGNDLTAF